MKYVVICGGNPYDVIATHMAEFAGVVKFFDMSLDQKRTEVAEFNASKIDGIIFEDNNLED